MLKTRCGLSRRSRTIQIASRGVESFWTAVAFGFLRGVDSRSPRSSQFRHWGERVHSKESLRLLRKEKLDQADSDMLANGLETVIGVLGALREEMPEENGGAIHQTPIGSRQLGTSFWRRGWDRTHGPPQGGQQISSLPRSTTLAPLRRCVILHGRHLPMAPFSVRWPQIFRARARPSSCFHRLSNAQASLHSCAPTARCLRPGLHCGPPSRALVTDRRTGGIDP